MHLTGKGVVEYLENLDGYETNAQKLLREKLVKSNRSLFFVHTKTNRQNIYGKRRQYKLQSA